MKSTSLFRFPRPTEFAKGCICGVAVAVAFAAGAGFSRERAEPGPVSATELTIVDKDGKVRGRWAIRDGASEIGLVDTKGRTRIGLQVREHPVMKLWGEQGENAVLVSQDQPTGSWLMICDQSGKDRLLFQASTQLASGALKDQQGHIRLDAVCGAEGTVELKLNDDKEVTVWRAVPKRSEAKLDLK